jgi:hypothetical protein
LFFRLHGRSPEYSTTKSQMTFKKKFDSCINKTENHKAQNRNVLLIAGKTYKAKLRPALYVRTSATRVKIRYSQFCRKKYQQFCVISWSISCLPRPIYDVKIMWYFIAKMTVLLPTADCSDTKRQTLDISFFWGYYIISPITAKKVI